MHATRRKSVTLVLGGVRSGKSHYAQQLGDGIPRVVFLATAETRDEEMRQKVLIHRNSRPPHWDTVEEPLDLAGAIGRNAARCDLLIIDCLTMFSANLLALHHGEASAADASIAACFEQLCQALRSASCSVVMVSNEVGSGVVPAYPSGRRFRDLLGELNQRVARVSDNVLLMVAGLPLALKGQPKTEMLQ